MLKLITSFHFRISDQGSPLYEKLLLGVFEVNVRGNYPCEDAGKSDVR
jgi:hypothetical protein